LCLGDISYYGLEMGDPQLSNLIFNKFSNVKHFVSINSLNCEFMNRFSNLIIIASSDRNSIPLGLERLL